MPDIVTVDGLATNRDFYQSLRTQDFRRVLPLLIGLRRHELDTGSRERWLGEHGDELEVMRSVLSQGMSQEAVEEKVKAYLSFRLLERPVDLVMLGLFMDEPAFVDEYVRVENKGILEANPGSVLACMHFGPHSGLVPLVAALDHETSGLLPRVEIDYVMSLIEMYCPETRQKLHPLPVPDRLVLLKCRQALREGRFVGLYIEASASDVPPSTVLPFLGRPTRCPEGPALAAAISGRPLIPALVLHEPDHRLRIIVEEPITVSRKPGALVDGLRALWQRLETRVLQYPEQWVGWEFLREKMWV